MNPNINEKNSVTINSMHVFSNTVTAISDTMSKHFTKYVSYVITKGTRMGVVALGAIQVTKSCQTGDK